MIGAFLICGAWALAQAQAPGRGRGRGGGGWEAGGQYGRMYDTNTVATSVRVEIHGMGLADPPHSRRRTRPLAGWEGFQCAPSRSADVRGK
jgi:hypothetical protein